MVNIERLGVRMRKAIYLLLALAMVATFVAPTGYATEDVKFEGIIIDASTGDPIAGAGIDLFPMWDMLERDVTADGSIVDDYWKEFHTVSTDDGTFGIDVPEGSYDVTVRAEGYQQSWAFFDVWEDGYFEIDGDLDEGLESHDYIRYADRFSLVG